MDISELCLSYYFSHSLLLSIGRGIQAALIAEQASVVQLLINRLETVIFSMVDFGAHLLRRYERFTIAGLFIH